MLWTTESINLITNNITFWHTTNNKTTVMLLNNYHDISVELIYLPWLNCREHVHNIEIDEELLKFLVCLKKGYKKSCKQSFSVKKANTMLVQNYNETSEQLFVTMATISSPSCFIQSIIVFYTIKLSISIKSFKEI